MRKLTVGELLEAILGDDEHGRAQARARFSDILDKNIERISDNINHCRNGVFFKFRIDPDTVRIKPMLAVSDKEIDGVPTLVVPEPRKAWRTLCGYILRKDGTRAVAVTGSIGKTTVKDMIFSVLNTQKGAIRCHDSVNGTRGFCCAVSAADKRIGLFSCEMGLNSPQNHFSVISEALRPEVCVITNIGSCHIENFRDKDHILECKLKCADHMSKENGLLLLNADDETLMKHTYEHKVKTFAVHSQNADYYCEDVTLQNSSVDFTAVCPGRKLRVHLNVPGEHNIYGALAAIATGEKLGISDELIVKGLAEFRTTGIRQNVYTVHDNITVINDCYGASPEANTVAFNMLAGMTAEDGQRKIALLGHISRMGRLSEQVHRDLGRKLASYGFDMVVTYGGKSSVFTEEVKAAGGEAYHFYDDAEFVDFVKKSLRPNDIVLCKGVHKSYDYDRYVEQIFDPNFTPALSPYYGSLGDIPSLHVTSPAMALMNSSRELLSGKNIHERRNVSNLISLISAVTALEIMNPNEIVTVSEKALRLAKGCRRFGLKEGEQYILRDLVWIALKPGGADAVYAIAMHYNKNHDVFMEQVNRTLRKIGAANTACPGPYGKIYDSYYSTAYDMALIAAYALKNGEFRDIISRNSITVMDIGASEHRTLTHTTKLTALNENDDHSLYSPDIHVLKEGGSEVSGRCIVAAKKNSDKADDYNIAVILGTQENEFTMLSYNETKCLLSYTE